MQLACLRRIIAAVDWHVWRSEPPLGDLSSALRPPRHSSAATSRDSSVCGHSERVARFAVRLAEQLGWNPFRLSMIYMAGLLHDVGKVGVDAEILHKPGGLTEREYGLIKTHPELGSSMLAGIERLAEVIPAVRYHHEHWDGTGYPCGLVGSDIPEMARIVAVADAYDAMTSDRPYRAGMSLDDVQRVFDAGAQTHWDAEIIQAYCHARADLDRMSRDARRA
jgi:putative nucleotidyltransferase with HDIG domain